MAIVTGSKVNFIYVKGSNLPATVDESTVYFVQGTSRLYVGSQLIADMTDYNTIESTYVASARLTANDSLQLLDYNGNVLTTVNYPQHVLSNTTAAWEAQTTLVSKIGYVYVYTDHQQDEDGNDIPGIKIGDGNAFVVDLPFTDTVYGEHIADTTIHVTSAEKTYWNNKVTCFLDPSDSEKLVFTTSTT